MNNSKPVAQFPCYTPATVQLDQQERNSFAAKSQPLSLKELVEQRFPRNCHANKTQSQEKQSATQATKRQGESHVSYSQLEKRIILMARRWDYTPEELTWALTQSKIKPREWSQVCTANEKLTDV